MQNILFALSLGFGGLLLAATPSQSQPQQGAACAERTQIVERLKSKYGESRRGIGLNQSNGVVEVFASAQTGSWTILVTLPNGMTCLLAAGQSYEGFTETEIKPGEDA